MCTKLNYKSFLNLIVINAVFFSIESKAQPSPYGFKNQFIGNKNFLKLYEDQKKDLCTNFWCINDAYYIFSKSSQYKDVDPCVDFKNFTVNQIDEVDAHDDRYIHRGFKIMVTARYHERLRKVVSDKRSDDNRIVKVMKNTFRKCIKSPHTFRHLETHQDLIEYLKSLGSSPFLSKHIVFNPNRFDPQKDYKFDSIPGNISNEDTLWNENDFNLTKIFEIEPWYALNIFFDLEVQRCENGLVCLNPSKYRTTDIVYKEPFSKLYYEIFKDIFDTLEDRHLMTPDHRKYAEDEMYRPAIFRHNAFLRARDELREKVVNDKSYKNDNVTVSELNEMLHEFGIDWLKIINRELLQHSMINENTTININNGGSRVMKEIANFLTNFDKKSLADALTISFIYHHRASVILHYYGRTDQIVFGTKHAPQRWERCINEYFIKLMHPALVVMYEQRRESFDRNLADFDRDSNDDRVKIPESAEIFIQEAIDLYKKVFINETDLDPSAAIDVLYNLKNIDIIVSLSKKLLPIGRLEEFYDELELSGDENFLESVIKMAKNHRQVLNEPKESWRRRIDEILFANGDNWIIYTIKRGNIIYFPPGFIMYPFYHPLRSRFFNIATLFTQVIQSLDKGVKEFINENVENASSFSTGISKKGVKQMIYEDYKEWLKTHKEREIGANHLTSLQLYWVVSTFQDYRKFHRAVHKNFAAQFRFQQEYLHVHTKFNEGFQEAFNCSMTEDEWKIYYDFKKRFYELG